MTIRSFWPFLATTFGLSWSLGVLLLLGDRILLAKFLVADERGDWL